MTKLIMELDTLTQYTAGPNGKVERGSEYINSTITGYDQAVQTFAEGKAMFIKQGNWIYSTVQDVDADKADRLTMLPMKVNFDENDITAEGVTVKYINSSIPEFVSQYYVINAKATEEEQQAAEEFLVWLYTSETGEDYIVNEFAFVPFNADSSTVLDNPLNNGLIYYMNNNLVLGNDFDAFPESWGLNTIGASIQEELLTNYDPSAYGDIMAKALGTLFFFHRGTSFIYHGQELGMRNTRFQDISEVDDINSAGQYQRCLEEGYTKEQALAGVNRRSRDHARLPMQWTNEEYFGFSRVRPWIVCNNRCPEISVQKEMSDDKSVFMYYKNMIWLRNKTEFSDVLIYGDITEVEGLCDNIIGYKRTLGTKKITILVNMSNQRYDIRQYLKNEELLLDNYGGNSSGETLRAYEALVSYGIT